MSSKAKELGTLESGQTVIDRPDGSHLNEGVAHVLHEALSKISLRGESFVRREINLGRIVGKNQLVATQKGDTIVYLKRPNHSGYTRFVIDRNPKDCSVVTVILKKGTEPDSYILITAFIGKLAPPEPWDEKAFLKDNNPNLARSQAKEFWSGHALVLEPDTEILGKTVFVEHSW